MESVLNTSTRTASALALEYSVFIAPSYTELWRMPLGHTSVKINLEGRTMVE